MNADGNRSGIGKKFAMRPCPSGVDLQSKSGVKTTSRSQKTVNERSARCRRKVRLTAKVVLVTPLICEQKYTRERILPTWPMLKCSSGVITYDDINKFSADGKPLFVSG